MQIGLQQPLRCALVSDLHDRCPDEVLQLLAEQKPDLILAAGDIMERHEENESPWTVQKMDEWQGIARRRLIFTKILKALDGSQVSKTSAKKRWNAKNGYRFLSEAVKIAPLVLGMGNHEWYYLPEDYAFFREHGIILLDNQDCEMRIGAQTLRIGALSTRWDMEWLDSYAAKDGIKLLISHHPNYYGRFIKDTQRNTFDLIVSGHAHGGQWRLFSRGGTRVGIPVFSSGQGLFPKYAYGQYDRMIVSAGVSNTTKIPRWGNPCELVMIELT